MLFLTLLAMAVTVMVSIVILSVPLMVDYREDDVLLGFALASIGLLGVTTGVLIVWSIIHSGRTALVSAWGSIATAFLFAMTLGPVFLGVGHLYGPTAIIFIALSIWNLQILEKERN